MYESARDTSDSDLRALVDTALGRFSRIDAVVNNTGHAPKGELLDLSDDDWRTGFDLLYLNVVRVARIVIPTMSARGAGDESEPSPDGRRPRQWREARRAQREQGLSARR
ncbi:SDR family oxidoreductase [bacterium]|nr:SDR family oxidoreductase [bacterium]